MSVLAEPAVPTEPVAPVPSGPAVSSEDRVLDAAKRCCERWGMAKVTVDDIAAEAGISRATLYRLFPGAKEVLYAMAFDQRYQAGVFNEGGIGLRMSNWTDAWYLTEKMKPHIPALEHHQVLALAAPRPFLLLGGDDGSGARGIADGDASWAFVRAALPVYRLYGAGERIGLYNHRGRHSVPKEARRLAYRWLDHWLKFRSVTDEVGEE